MTSPVLYSSPVRNASSVFTSHAGVSGTKSFVDVVRRDAAAGVSGTNTFLSPLLAAAMISSAASSSPAAPSSSSSVAGEDCRSAAATMRENDPARPI